MLSRRTQVDAGRCLQGHRGMCGPLPPSSSTAPPQRRARAVLSWLQAKPGKPPNPAGVRAGQALRRLRLGLRLPSGHPCEVIVEVGQPWLGGRAHEAPSARGKRPAVRRSRV